MTNPSISEKLLQISVDRLVSETLGGMVRKFADFTKDMSMAEKQEAGLKILDLMKVATNDFFIKMEKRIQSKSV